MHILIIPSWYPTTESPLYGIFFKEQAEALSKFGYHVSVVYVNLWSLSSLGRHKEKLGISYSVENDVHTYRVHMYNFLPKIPNGFLIIQNLCLNYVFEKITQKHSRPDIIHAHSSLMGGYLAMKLSDKKGIPFVVTEHRTAFARNLITSKDEEIIKTIMGKTKKMIVVGPGLKQSLSKYSDDKITIIPNLVNVDEFRAERKKNDKPFRFFSLALLTHKKGMDILLRAFANEFVGNRDYELVIGGDGEEKENLKSLAEELNILRQVKFLGKLSRADAKKEMALCNAFVLASRFETFGIVFIEALACGKPIIATACGGPEIIVNENNGLLVPLENPVAYGQAMKQLVHQYSRYEPNIIRQDCIDRFSEKAVISQLRNIYEAVK